MKISPTISVWIGVLIMIEQAIGGGTVLLTNAIPEAFIPIVKSWCLILAFVGTAVLTGLHAISSAAQGPLAPSLDSLKKIAACLAFLAVTFLLMPGANAQVRRPQITGNIVQDTKANLGVKTSGSASTASSPCDFNLFANLTATNVLDQINTCVQSRVSDAANLFLPDVTAALSSATAFKDEPGMACLKPGLAIVQAAAGTPAVPATDTTPAVAAVLPGPILIFQKFREFELSGGPAACKTWVNSTVSGANPLTN